jgi:selenocysteine lyase/cysteine desulfurase
MTTTRRKFMGGAAPCLFGALAIAPNLGTRIAEAARRFAKRSADDVARDEGFWLLIREAYDLDSRQLILNAGASNPSPRSVQNALVRYTEYANGSPLVNNYGEFAEQRERVRRRLAGMVHCEAEEIAVTRNTTEALQAVLFGLPLAAGDEILATNWEYHSMWDALRQREKRDGIVAKQVEIRLPTSESAEIVAAIRGALTPRTKALLVSHVVDGQGQILPIRQICDTAHQHGVQVIVDGALSFGQIACDLRALDCDYFGTSLHKWLSAPLGTGFLYVRRKHIESLWSLYATGDSLRNDIRKFEQVGTQASAPIAATNQALDFYETIGVAVKEARLRYLTQYWTARVSRVERVRINTPLTAKCSCGLVHLSITGLAGREISDRLKTEFDIYAFPVARNGLEGVYVSPNLFTRLVDLDVLVDAVVAIGQ